MYKNVGIYKKMWGYINIQCSSFHIYTGSLCIFTHTDYVFFCISYKIFIICFFMSKNNIKQENKNQADAILNCVILQHQCMILSWSS